MQKKYMETLLAQIREKRARECVRLEVEGHMAEQKACYMADGMPEEQAEARTVADMGDPVETGAALDQIHKPKPAWGMLAMIAVLCTAGVLLQYAVQISGQTTLTENYYFHRQCRYAVLGFLLLCGVYLTDYTRIARYSRFLCTGILLLLCLAAGGNIQMFPRIHAQGFLNLEILYWWLNPEETVLISLNVFFYLYLPLYGAVLYSFRSCTVRQLWKILLYTVLPVYLAIQLSSISVLINFTLILFLMLGTAVYEGWFPLPVPGLQKAASQNTSVGRKRAKRLGMMLTGIAVFFFLIFRCMNAYQATRIQAWLNPGAFAGEAGYLPGMIRNIIRTSQLIGQNTGQLTDYPLPEANTDFILTYTVGRFGFLAAAALIMLVIMLGIKLLHLSIHQKNQLGMIMGLGCSLAFVIQSAEYILVNLSLLPAGSLYLPLVSFGGSGMLQSCFLLGILLSIYRYENIVPSTESKHAGKAIL